MATSSSRGDTPFRLNLEQQKKRARELLKAGRSNDPFALTRIQQHHPQSARFTRGSDIALADAQLVIARELGLTSWAKLKMHIQALNRAEADIQSGQTAPDADMATLHVRCGSDLQGTLPAAGFEGDFLEYSDPVCQGPVSCQQDALERRVTFLDTSYGGFMDLPTRQLRNRLIEAKSRLAGAAQQYSRMVLWFEHDSYDQLILARILAILAEQERPAQVELLSIHHFPGNARFIGLGQLPPEAIRMLWQQRQPVTAQQYSAGFQVWEALCADSPLALDQLRQSSVLQVLPDMSGALLRHLQELPSSFNGLGLTQQLTLEMLAEEAITAGRAFHALMTHRDPRPWLGDVMYWHILEQLANAQRPAIVYRDVDPAQPWHKRTLELTETGRRLLAGDIDWSDCGPAVRWLGGVEITPGTEWRWDASDASLLSQL
jgi:hypothetical protein